MKTLKPKQFSTLLAAHDLKFLASTPFVYHCHHFNLFHDQTVEDALGVEEAFTVRSWAAQQSAWQLLAGLVERSGAANAVERLQLATSIFAWLGHGTLELQTTADGGTARGQFLHYSFAWREKYGSKVRRRTPVDAFAAGFAAAASEVAFDLTCGTLEAKESVCFACLDPACTFEIIRRAEAIEVGKRVDEEAISRRLHEPLSGHGEETIQAITQGLNDFLGEVGGDERGLIQAFGIFVTRHLSAYYDQTAYDTIHYIEKNAPQATAVVEELFGESGHVCVFFTFGNLLLSPEWEGLVGPVKGEVEEVITSCTAIARALGFGHWTIGEIVPGKKLVMRSTSNYEFPFYLETYGPSEKPRCYFFANAARAIMQLAHRVDWPSKPVLSDALYQDLFKNQLGWKVEETHCCAKGDDHCEVVVSSA